MTDAACGPNWSFTHNAAKVFFEAKFTISVPVTNVSYANNDANRPVFSVLDLKHMVKTELRKEKYEATEILPLWVSRGTRKERTENFETEKTAHGKNIRRWCRFL